MRRTMTSSSRSRVRATAAAALLAGGLGLSSAPAQAAPGRGFDVDLGAAAVSAERLAGGSVLDDGAGGAGTLRTARGAAVTARTVDGVPALRLAQVCRTALQACPRALVEVAGSEDVDPGRADFSLTAQVHLEPWRTSDGANVVQKGWNWGGAGQYKMQVDGRAGKPSCVVVGTGTTKTYRAVARESVADGMWHELGCRRTGDRLEVLVDGEVARSTAIPARLSISNDSVVRVGAKGLGGVDVDQFPGHIGRVTVHVEG
ncbi:LamG-like jellyroll fold domain-containing protein [uncultured Pseudokineococcus sp.]|uniref:LamG-like jellyroll fold domain-containing protein n=1 Tax=uncultured Pseudokineococcus sp. TaxID=1642928 RepID=UPI00263651FA|nr:LamG-like jellyroll fold domain-containing protein [uncultured Pseudokineococcus sp.]